MNYRTYPIFHRNTEQQLGLYLLETPDHSEDINIEWGVVQGRTIGFILSLKENSRGSLYFYDGWSIRRAGATRKIVVVLVDEQDPAFSKIDALTRLFPSTQIA
jgi:hypothetical protein